MSSEAVVPRSSTNLEIRSRPSNDASLMTWLAAAPRLWAGTSRHAINADTSGSPTTPVETAIVPSAKELPRPNGSTARASELLPVEYFHVVFTLPEVIGPIALQNPRVVYGILFQAAAETLSQIAADPKHLGAEIGILAVLHTWGQNLLHHPHVHCVVPGGGLSPDGSPWIACPPGFFLPVRVLSCVFRGNSCAAPKRVRSAATVVLRQAERVVRPVAVPATAGRQHPHRLGRVREAPIRRSRGSTEVFGAVHASGGDC